jgi:hypothetical protein
MTYLSNTNKKFCFATLVLLYGFRVHFDPVIKIFPPPCWNLALQSHCRLVGILLPVNFFLTIDLFRFLVTLFYYRFKLRKFCICNWFESRDILISMFIFCLQFNCYPIFVVWPSVDRSVWAILLFPRNLGGFSREWVIKNVIDYFKTLKWFLFNVN